MRQVEHYHFHHRRTLICWIIYCLERRSGHLLLIIRITSTQSDIGKGLNDYIRLVDKCNITEEMIPKNWSYFLKWILLKWLGPLLYYFFLRRSNSLISKHIRRLLIYCTHSHSSSTKETESVSQKDKSQKDKKYTFLNSTFSSLWAN